MLIGSIPILGPAADESEPGVSRRRPLRHREPRRARRAPRARHRAGRVRLHAADRRRAAARELPAGPRGPARLRRQPRADRRSSARRRRATRTTRPLRAFWNRLLERVRALPGVEAAGIANSIPLGGNYNDSVILAEGYAMAPGESLISPFNACASRPATSRRCRFRSSAGASSPTSDDERAPNGRHRGRAARQRFWKDQDPVGRRMWKPDSAEEFKTGPGPKSRYLHGRRRRRQRAHDRA